MIQDYNQIVKDLDKAFKWCKAKSLEENITLYMPEINRDMKQWTAIVFGECGQGKSTTLNEIIDIAAENYYKG